MLLLIQLTIVMQNLMIILTYCRRFQCRVEARCRRMNFAAGAPCHRVPVHDVCPARPGHTGAEPSDSD